MNKNLSIIILSCCLFAICSCSFKKVIHNTDPEAKCLDGTPGLIFVDEGTVDKFIIYFIGGGYCG